MGWGYGGEVGVGRGYFLTALACQGVLTRSCLTLLSHYGLILVEFVCVSYSFEEKCRWGIIRQTLPQNPHMQGKAITRPAQSEHLALDKILYYICHLLHKIFAFLMHFNFTEINKACVFGLVLFFCLGRQLILSFCVLFDSCVLCFASRGDTEVRLTHEQMRIIKYTPDKASGEVIKIFAFAGQKVSWSFVIFSAAYCR